MTIKILNALLAIIGGIGGAMILFWLLNKLAESLKGQMCIRDRPGAMWWPLSPARLAGPSISDRPESRRSTHLCDDVGDDVADGVARPVRRRGLDA